MNAFFGNYPLLNLWFPYKDSHSRRSSSQSTTTNSSFKFRYGNMANLERQESRPWIRLGVKVGKHVS
ncbi:hypothetical protein T08_10180, partial [Trichinella sp. T8]